MLKIFYGRESVDKEKFLFDRLCEAGKGILLVPDQFTFEAEKALLERSKGGALIDIEVLSMSRLGYRLLEELGGGKRTFIDKYGRHMLLWQIIRESRDELKVFAGMEAKSSFVDMVNNFIAELKQYNCGTKELAEIEATLEEDSYLKRKLSDIRRIYEKYEARIDGKYTDSEDYIDLFLSKISRSKLVGGAQVWLYGFDSFSPKSLSVVGEILGAAAEVNVILTCSTEKSRDEELFFLTRLVAENLKKQAEARDVPVYEEELSTGAHAVCEAQRPRPVQAVERELFALPPRVSDCGEGDGLVLLEAGNIYTEAESAAAHVLHLVRDEGYRYRDIKVICNDQDVRGPILRRVFKEYGMDLVSDATKDISQNPIIQYIMNMLDVVIEDFRRDVVIGVMKTGFAGVADNELSELENYAFKYKIRGSMWRKPFVRGLAEYGETGMEFLNGIRERAVEPMLNFKGIFKAKTTKDFVDGLYKSLYDDLTLPEKILSLMKSREAEGRPDLAEELGQIWGQIVGLLDQISEIAGEGKFDAKEFRKLLQIGISQVKIGVLPPTQDSLVMGTMQRTRSGAIRALVVVGANEGVLPSAKSAGGIFGSDEKELFKEKGVEICRVDSVKQMEEYLGIYRSLSKPTDSLYVSYSKTDKEGNALKASSIFQRLTELFPRVKVRMDVVSGESPLLVNGELSGLRHLTKALQDVTEGRAMPHMWDEALDWYKAKRPEALKPVRAGIAFTNKQEALGREKAQKLYRWQPGDEPVVSPSRVERFSRCPFSHFISYGIRPEELRTFEVAPRELGDVYHLCLMEMSRMLTEEGVALTAPESKWMTVTKEECAQKVREIIEGAVAGYKDGLFTQGKEEEYRAHRIVDVCQEACWVMIMQVRAGHILSSRFEEPFGEGREIPAIEVPLFGGDAGAGGDGIGDNGADCGVGDSGGNADGGGGSFAKTLRIEGKIDRLDFLKDDKVKVIDYKTGKDTFSAAEAAGGYRLQLMLYLRASEDKTRKPAGVFYFNIKEPMINVETKTVDEEKLQKQIRKNFKMNGLMVDDEDVIKGIAGEFSGYSEIVPLQKTKDALKGSLLSEEDFQRLERAVEQKVKDVCRDLVNGRLDVHPMKVKKTSACLYCQFKGICRFDTIFDGCSYNIVM